MRRSYSGSNRRECFSGRPQRKTCCDDCYCSNCKPQCCPSPAPTPIDCCPSSTPQFALVSFSGTLNPQICVNNAQTFQICTSASCNLVGQQVFFEALLEDAGQSDNITVVFLPPGEGAPIPVPFVNGRAVFPPPPQLQALRNGCSDFRITLNEVGLYVLTVNVIRADTGVTLASETIGLTAVICPPINEI